MLRTLFFATSMVFFASFALAQKKYSLFSPDGKINVEVEIGKEISYTIDYEKESLLLPSKINLITQYNAAGFEPKIQRTQTRSVNTTITSPVPEKRKIIPDIYNELNIHLKQPFTIVFRAYNDGVAYRWLTRFTDSVTVYRELASFSFPAPHPVYFSEVQKRQDVDSFHTSFEEPYIVKSLDSIADVNLIFTPTLVAPAIGPKILITESDLEDYPGMFLRGTGKNNLQGDFAPYPLEEYITEGEFPQAVVKRRAEFIARAKGNRSYPWRVMAIAKEDRELPDNDIVYRLAPPSRIGDAFWVNPGQGTDEWIIGINLFNVPFKAGINTATYKYYIDFAQKFGLERIMLDAGWSDYKDLFKINPSLDIDELSAYAKSKGVKLSMWTLAMTLDKQLEPALQQFQKWGVDFVMTDFMDRDDQSMVNFYHRMAQAFAKYKIMIMFHGAFKPAGFNRTYPHAVTREGVLGSEYNIWSEKATPEHNVLLPFIRMVAGPMDYEPGLLDNATKETFRPIGGKVMSIGTRCNQLAMFVVYESPIQIFSGNPSQGLLETDFMELLGSIPTTWDETKVVDGKVGDYIVTARKKGNAWYLGAMTDATARTLTVGLDFLGNGEYETTICEDGINAGRYASDYVLKKVFIKKNDTLTLKLAPGGGYVARLKKR